MATLPNARVVRSSLSESIVNQTLMSNSRRLEELPRSVLQPAGPSSISPEQYYLTKLLELPVRR